ncbi:MAG TPA: RdgB/HAM1 family non-canonical purine NTP pyrophosphatase [Steroidobacteraceae bacterium]|nr:RdgB/HAM1 family non-canonical purine NTP pyrophosphatase [Steroidobacteraceae bacterium]
MLVRERSIVLASNNPGKIAELVELLAPHRVSICPLAQFTHESAEESGVTFRENALLKARFATNMAKMPAIADDSGLEVDALDGAPGVFSARYAGEQAGDAANNQKLLDALASVPDGQRGARFRCVLAYVHDANAEPLLAEGVWEGQILRSQRGTNGFGYDPLFLPAGSKKSSAELSREEKNRVSHRAQALRALIDLLLRKGELA